MDIPNILLKNLIAIPILCFLFGILFSAFRMDWLFRPKIGCVEKFYREGLRKTP